MKKSIPFIALLLVLSVVSTEAQRGRPSRQQQREHREHRDLGDTVYATADDGTPLKWKVFSAAGPGPHPAVLVIHGGGFDETPASPKMIQSARGATISRGQWEGGCNRRFEWRGARCLSRRHRDKGR